MNNSYVHDDSFLLQFRLRAARRKKRMQHKDWDKQLLALDRQLSVLYRQWHNLGWVELHPPVVRGWKRYFVLRHDVARSSEAVFFQTLLNKINITQYSHRKDFKVKKRSGGKKVYAARVQHLMTPNEHQFKKFSLSEVEQRYFEERRLIDTRTGKAEKQFVFAQPWRFVLRVRPHIVRKTRVRDQTIESSIQQITNYLARNAFQHRLSHLMGGYRYSWKQEREREKNPLQNKSLTAILDAYYQKSGNRI